MQKAFSVNTWKRIRQTDICSRRAAQNCFWHAQHAHSHVLLDTQLRKDKSLQGWLMGATVWGGMLPMFCLFAPWHDGMKQVPGMLKAGDWFVSRSFPGLGLPRFSSGSTGFQKKAVQKQDLQ